MYVLVPLFIFFGIAVAVFGLLPTGKERPRPPVTQDARVKAGPYVASTTTLSASEDLRIVVVPSALGEPLDTKCFLYRNREWQQSVFTCPDARQDDISLPEHEQPRP
jgi:hypothetical protein